MKVKIKKIKSIYIKNNLDCKMVDLFDDIEDKSRPETLRNYINDLEDFTTGYRCDIDNMSDKDLSKYVEFLEYLADK